MEKSAVRPSWEHFWILQALLFSSRATCDRLRTGCVIVKNQRIVGAGYNGSTRNAPHCDNVGHDLVENHCERTVHGEENAVINTERANLAGATAYIVGTPCIRCAKVLVNAGIAKVYCIGSYDNARGGFDKTAEIFSQAHVAFKRLDLDPNMLIQEFVERLSGKGGALYKK